MLMALMQGLGGGSGGNPYAGLLQQPSQNPFVMAGMGVSQLAPAMHNPYASTGRNFATSAGAGLASALLAGLGARQTDTRNAAAMEQALALQDATDDPTRRALVEQNPKLAPLYAQLAQTEKKAEQARLAEEAKAQRQMEDYQAKQLFNLSLLPEKERIKGMYNPSGTKVTIEGNKPNPFDVLGVSARDDLFTSQKLVERFSSLADKIEKSPIDEVSLKGGRFLGALDKENINQELNDVQDLVKRLRTGAATNMREDSFYPNLIVGDLTVPKAQMVQRLRNYAGLMAGDARMLIESAEQASVGNFEGIKSQLDKVIQQRQQIGGAGQQTPAPQAITIRTKDGQMRTLTPEQAAALGLGK